MRHLRTINGKRKNKYATAKIKLLPWYWITINTFRAKTHKNSPAFICVLCLLLYKMCEWSSIRAQSMYVYIYKCMYNCAMYIQMQGTCQKSLRTCVCKTLSKRLGIDYTTYFRISSFYQTIKKCTQSYIIKNKLAFI